MSHSSGMIQSLRVNNGLRKSLRERYDSKRVEKTYSKNKMALPKSAQLKIQMDNKVFDNVKMQKVILRLFVITISIGVAVILLTKMGLY